MMRLTLITLLLTITHLTSFGQREEVTYYSKKGKALPSQEKAVSKKIVRYDTNGQLEFEQVIQLLSGKITNQFQFRGEEPIGVWIEGDKQLDYDFPLVTSPNCTQLNQEFDLIQDDSLKNYVAPKFNNSTIFKYIATNMHYPYPALRNNIEGKVVLILSVDKQGRVHSVSAMYHKSILLAKEAVRFMRNFQFDQPATLDGEAIELECIKFILTFKLR